MTKAVIFDMDGTALDSMGISVYNVTNYLESLGLDINDPKVQELAYLTTYYKQHGDILLDAGDASQGLPINNISEGAEMGCLMSEMGYNAMTIGNHEFDYTLNHVIDPNQDGFFKS